MRRQIYLLVIVSAVQITNAADSPDQIVEKCFSSNSHISLIQSKSIAKVILGTEDGDTDLITDSLLDEYAYEITHNASTLLINKHTVECICKRERCLLLCSPSITVKYAEMVRDKRSSAVMERFYISLTLANGAIVRRHIVRDFRTIVFNYYNFCTISYSLTPETNPSNSWALFENHTLLRHHDLTYLMENEYCFDVDQIDAGLDDFVINPVNCAKENTMTPMEFINNASMAISIILFTLTILAYCMLPQLLDIPGKCFVSYISCVTISYSFLSFVNLSKIIFAPTTCITFGFINHYIQMAYCVWLGIISFNTWQSFSNLLHQPSYVTYAIFGWTTPLIWTLVTVCAQYSDLPEYLTPGITAQHCGLDVDKWAATIYLYGPCLIILLLCMYAFISTSRIINDNERNSKPYKTGFGCPKIRYTLYLRLFIVMGLSWSLDVVSYILAMLQLADASCIMDFVNAVQGLYIFFNFIGRQKVRNLIKDRWFSNHSAVTSFSYRSTSASH